MTDSDRDGDAAERAELDAELERTRKLILERRNRFMAAALAGIGMATSACTRASVCLRVAVDAGGNGGGGGIGGSRPSVCLSGRGAIDTGGTGGSRPPRPTVCLSDSGIDDEVSDGG